MASKRIKKKAIEKTRFGGSRYWVAVGTLAAYSAAGSGRIALAEKSSPGEAGPDGKVQALPVRRFDIPAGQLGDALTTFTKITSVKVAVSIDDIRIFIRPESWASTPLNRRCRN